MTSNSIADERKLTKKQQAANERNRTIEDMRAAIKPGDTVYTVQRGAGQCFAFLVPEVNKHSGRLAIYQVSGQLTVVLKGWGLRWNRAGDGLQIGSLQYPNEVVQALGQILYNDPNALQHSTI